jgi:rubrerythrin
VVIGKELTKMKLHTASETISFAKKLEDESAKFYKDLSQKYGKDEDAFLSFGEENRKNITQVERAYYGVITDAIEGCFAFDVETDEYSFDNELADNASYADALSRAIEIEEKIIKFYTDAGEQSSSLMADVPKAFKMIAKKRRNRELKLKSLLEK